MSPRSVIAAQEAPALGIGYYTVPEAARLIGMPARSINRWLGGYAYRSGGKPRRMPPLWTPELPANDDGLELGFATSSSCASSRPSCVRRWISG